MPDIPRKKVGIVSCSGEEIPEGTISRIATRLVLEKLRPEDTVTICLPLFLAGGQEERAFARFYPTIAVDGCPKLCAKHGTERYSGQVTDVIVVSELLNGQEIKPGWRRSLDGRGMRLAEQVAEVIASRVDGILKATYEEVKPDLIPVTIQDKAPSPGQRRSIAGVRPRGYR
ncbi:MAG: putative zinc-binding protein [Chloroflexota bacterium]